MHIKEKSQLHLGLKSDGSLNSSQCCEYSCGNIRFINTSGNFINKAVKSNMDKTVLTTLPLIYWFLFTFLCQLFVLKLLTLLLFFLLLLKYCGILNNFQVAFGQQLVISTKDQNQLFGISIFQSKKDILQKTMIC